MSNGGVARPSVHLFDREADWFGRETRRYRRPANFPWLLYGMPRRRRAMLDCSKELRSLRSRRNGCHPIEVNITYAMQMRIYDG
jgi:hypothetical protein